MDRDELGMMVARNIQAAMERKGLTAPALARLASLNPTGIYDILSGKSRSPRLDTIHKIANALNIPVSQVFEEATADELRQEIIAAVERLPLAERRRLLRTAQVWGEGQA